MITRRGLFGVLAGAVAAPIVVRSGLLMPVKALSVSSRPEHKLIYHLNSAYTRYTGYEILNVTPVNVISATSSDLRWIMLDRPLLRVLWANA